ncbi:S24/S26 family peptidase [Streptomyces longwoodensis]|uniref:S24/S26 family peptidase n=1 Tax=Streptomyces longwoodensis TaxID=68231 RepID=UPI0033FB8490
MLRVIGSLLIAAFKSGRSFYRRWCPFMVCTIKGTSMYPTLSDGDRILVARLPFTAAPGRIALIESPDPVHGWALAGQVKPGVLKPRLYVKRVIAQEGDHVPRGFPSITDKFVPDGMLILRGDHPASEDSKQWGYYPSSAVLGVMLTRL